MESKGRSGRAHLFWASAVLAWALLGIPLFALGQTVKEFPLPMPRRGPQVIVAGPDRALWFTEQDFISGRKIGRMTLSGTITEFPIPGANPIPVSLVVGPDGALWFEDYGDGQIDRMTTSGEITSFPVPLEATYGALDMAFGPDGNLWFTMGPVGKIGRMTPQGVFSEYKVPTPPLTASFPNAITAGPDGAVWFCDLESRAVGRITTEGVISMFPLPGRKVPFSITSGADGAVWAGAFFGLSASIIRVDIGGLMQEFALPAPFLGAGALTVGRDDAIWFLDNSVNRVGRLTSSGQLTWLDIPSSNPTGSYPVGMTVGPDGNMWFTEYGDNEIGRVARGVLRQPKP
jgi:virginiamycin B lyase